MSLNNKGQIVIVAMMVCVVIFIMAITFAKPLRESIDTSLNSSSALNCTGNYAGLTTANQATCAIMDMGFFYFISSCIAVGLAFLTGRRTVTGVLTAITVTIFVIILITPLKDVIVDARDASHLDCDNTSISIGSRLTCIFVDLWLFYYVLAVIAAGITYATLKQIPEGGT